MFQKLRQFQVRISSRKIVGYLTVGRLFFLTSMVVGSLIIGHPNVSWRFWYIVARVTKTRIVGFVTVGMLLYLIVMLGGIAMLNKARLRKRYDYLIISICLIASAIYYFLIEIGR